MISSFSSFPDDRHLVSRNLRFIRIKGRSEKVVIGAAKMMEKQRDQEGRRQQQEVAARVVHSQVRRIKQEEDEKVKVHETYQHQVSEMRLVLRDIARQRSRSPLGRVGRPAISIGGDS